MSERVLVTGAGIISAIGIGVESTCESLVKGESGIAPVSHLETEHSEFPVGEVKLTNAEMAAMIGAQYPVSELRTVLMGIIAAREAVDSARLTADEMCGAAFINGTTVGGMDKTEKFFRTVFDTNAEADDSLELKYNDCGYSTNLIADGTGQFKLVTTTSTACSSAANAIIFGANLIKAGLVDIVVAGGSESLTRFHLNGFNSLMILDRDRCRPFDKGRAGINLGEGAAYVVLESESSAKRRRAKVMAELKGYANTCDAFHQTATSENGEGPYLAMRKALDMARLHPDEIDYINAHGTGTPNNDECELAAMERIWGVKLPHFSSTKSFTGHTTSASGSIETVICLLGIKYGFLPHNIGFENPIHAGAEPLAETHRSGDINNIINNSFGFGGNDSSLILSRINECL